MSIASSSAVRWTRFLSACRPACLLLGATAASLEAQTWTYRSLHPAAAEGSALTAATARSAGGNVGDVFNARATLLLPGVVDLHPAGAQTSSLSALVDGHQVGSISVPEGTRAHYWRGSAASGVTLHPADATSSIAEAVTPTYQAGYIYKNGTAQARIWRGSATDFTDLHSGNVYAASQVFAAWGDVQAGRVTVQNFERAALWRGTAASFVDLHPAGALTSTVLAVSPNLQGGSFTTLAGAIRGGIWRGTAASFVDLHPAGASSSIVTGVTDACQVGLANFDGGQATAAYWRGTAASFRSLGAVLPSSYVGSQARSVWIEGDQVFVAGSASTAQRSEAILWIGTFHRPAITVRGGSTLRTAAPRVVLRGRATDVDGDLARVEVRLGGARYVRATGTARWRFPARLRPGVNRLLVRAVDTTGRTSRPLSIRATRLP